MAKLQAELEAWFTGRLPDGWFTGPPQIRYDADEILVVGRLEPPAVAGDADPDARDAGATGRIRRFREDTRTQRMRIADEAERRFDRKVAWGASVDDTTEVFTSLAIPVMTRLRLRERAVLDTLIDGGVARSRSEALAWCVRLVARHEADWISELRDAISGVHKVREQGPAA